jgi:hypothetical protein
MIVMEHGTRNMEHGDWFADMHDFPRSSTIMAYLIEVHICTTITWLGHCPICCFPLSDGARSTDDRPLINATPSRRLHTAESAKPVL